MAEELLTTAQLSEMTGQRAGTLRMWESRHGFPVPVSLPGGHHRYDAATVAAVRDVVARRAAGLSLRAAIDRAKQGAEAPRTSIFASLRQLRPQLQPYTVTKRALLALTHAIEDEHLALSQGGVAIASFQTERNYRASRRRWQEIAKDCEVAVVLADFDQLRDHPDGPLELPVAARSPMHREWALIVQGPAGAACVSAWEPPCDVPRPDASREFEAIWTFDPTSVADALRAARDVISGLAGPVASRLAASIAELPNTQAPDMRFASALSGRAFAYLADQIGRQ
jgi:DICT domain-containing protein